MKIIETIKNKARKILLEDLDPFRRWKINWTQVIKKGDDSSSVRRDKVAKSFEAWERNPIAASGIEYKVTYILGKGLGYSTEHPKVKEKLDEFWKINNMPISHIEIVRSLFVDGEVFLHFPKTRLGQIPIMVPIDAPEITYITRDPENFRKIVYYHRSYEMPKYPDVDDNAPAASIIYEKREENIPAEDVIHFKIGSLSNLSRGRGHLYRILEYLDEYTAWLKIRKALNKAKSAFSWIFKLSTDNQTSIDLWQSKLNDFAKYDKDGNLLDAIPTGQPMVIGKSMDVKAESPTIGAGGAAEDGRQIKLMAAVGMRLPEFMLSDGENANLATTQSQEAPMVRCMEADQEMVRLFFIQIFDKVLDMMIESGDLEETYIIKTTKDDGNVEEIEKPTRELYDLIFPEIATSDVSELADPLEKMINSKVLSRETACTLLGYDWKQEKEKIKNEEQQGFVSVIKHHSIFNPIAEEMNPSDLNLVNKLRIDCQKELKENFEQYKKNLIDEVSDAKDIFITTHQEIVKKYLEEGAREAYANRVLKTINA